MSRMVSFLVLVGIIVVIGIMFYRVMASFLLPLFLAAVLTVMFRPMHHYLTNRFHGRRRLAALTTTVAVILVVMIPVGLVITAATIEASSLVIQFRDDDIAAKLAALRSKLYLDMPCVEEIRYVESSFKSLISAADAGATARIDEQSLGNLLTALTQLQAQTADLGSADKAKLLDGVQEAVQRAAKEPSGTLQYKMLLQDAATQFHTFRIALAGGATMDRLKQLANPTEKEVKAITSRLFATVPSWLQSVGGATGSFVFKWLLGIVITVVGIYFFLADGQVMVRTVMRLSPLDDRHETELLTEFDRVSRAVVVATLLSAAVQALLAGGGFWAIGMQSVFLLMVLTGLFALIPFVGAGVVWFPVVLWLFFVEERYLTSILLGLYGAGVISSADNVIKPLVLHGQSNLHPLLALLSVLGGVQALGPVGILIGPMVVAFLQTSLNILHRELTSLEPRTPRGAQRDPLPFIFSLRRRSLRLTYATPRTVRQLFMKERAE
jgi:predicted PurR-regulated permease PerM